VFGLALVAFGLAHVAFGLALVAFGLPSVAFGLALVVLAVKLVVIWVGWELLLCSLQVELFGLGLFLLSFKNSGVVLVLFGFESAVISEQAAPSPNSGRLTLSIGLMYFE
jgi:hypothetical protein